MTAFDHNRIGELRIRAERAEAKAERYEQIGDRMTECFQAGHPLDGDRCACGVVARAIRLSGRWRHCGRCGARIRPDDHTTTVLGAVIHAECHTPQDAA